MVVLCTHPTFLLEFFYKILFLQILFKKIIYLNTSPRGKKSRPTIDSNKELLPALYVPRTAILGKLMC